MKKPRVRSDLGSLFAWTRNTQKRVWVSMVPREKSVQGLPFCEIPQSPAHGLQAAQWGEVQIWLLFKKCGVFSQPSFPQPKRRVIKLCLYLGRGKLTIEVISQNISELNKLCSVPHIQTSVKCSSLGGSNNVLDFPV